MWHFRDDLQAVSRFSEAELRGHWERIAEFVLSEGEGKVREKLGLLGLGDAREELVQAVESDRANPPIDPEILSEETGPPAIMQYDIEKLYTRQTHPSALPIPDPANLTEHSRQFMKVDMDKLDNPIFDILWGKGEPLVVDGVGKRMKMSWGPDDFIERFGDEMCCECTFSASHDKM
jgi:hypothetical protein